MLNELKDIDKEIKATVGFTINVNANEDLKKAFDKLGLPYGYTELGSPSFTEAILTSVDHRLPELVLLKRKRQKFISTFIESYLLESHVDGFVHGQFHQLRDGTRGARSGRLSSSNPNLQNIPSRSKLGKLIREAFVPDLSHMFWRKIDYSQIEYRILAHFAVGEGSDEVRRRYNADPHTDFHKLVQEIIFTITGLLGAEDDRPSVKTINFGCVPMDTQALTQRGWLLYDELRVGDKTLGLKDGKLIWTAILEKVKYAHAPLIEMSSGKFKAQCTPNHRWYGNQRHGTNQGDRWYVDKVFTAEEMNTEHSIYLSRPASVEDASGLTPDEAALVAWLHTDGYVNWKSGRTTIRVLQAKPEYVAQIKELLARASIPHTMHVAKLQCGQKWPVHHFLIQTKYARQFWHQAGLFEHDLETLVRKFGVDQRRAFVDAAIAAEGTNRGSTSVFAQNEGPVADAMRLAFFMDGYFPTTSTSSGHSKIRLCTPKIGGQRMRIRPLDNTDVWCIRTELGSWVMRQGQRIMLTGNTLYGMGKKKLARSLGLSSTRAQTLFDAIHHAAPFLRDTMDVTGKEADENGFITTILGRRSRFEKFVPGHYDETAIPLPYEQAILRYGNPKRAYLHKALNRRLQGSAADLLKKAMLDAWQAGIFDVIGVPRLTVHDELDFSVMEENKEAFAALYHIMETAISFSVPVKVDVEDGPNWGLVQKRDA
jgi:hypothetical protein